jgi:hypothetical protein
LVILSADYQQAAVDLPKLQDVAAVTSIVKTTLQNVQMEGTTRKRRHG